MTACYERLLTRGPETRHSPLNKDRGDLNAELAAVQIPWPRQRVCNHLGRLIRVETWGLERFRNERGVIPRASTC